MLKIENSEFGQVTVDGKRYEHDIVIFPDKIIRRKKCITKDKHGTSHKFTRDEMEEYLDQADRSIKEVIVGTGQYDKLGLLPETKDHLEEKDIYFEEKRTEDLVGEDLGEGSKLVIIHVTC